MRLYQMLSYLLDYPQEEWRDSLPALHHMLAEEELDDAERQALKVFLDVVANTDIIELQRIYVDTFDLKAQHSLHLTHHLLGDDKNRGPALIDLGEYYKAWGMESIEGELPDYLPLMLEFTAHLEEEEANLFLSQFGKVLAVLADNLDEAQSAWAPLVRIAERRAQLAHLAA